MSDTPNYKTTPLPPGPPGPDLSNSSSAELAVRTWKHAAEHNKNERTKLEERIKDLQDEHDELLKIEVQLGRRDPENPFPTRKLRDSLHLLAELFVSKYPQEDSPIVQNLVEMFVGPVEKNLEGDSDAEPPSDTFIG